MKKFFTAALFVCAITLSAFASPRTISTKVNEHFVASFGKAKNVSWKTDGRFDKVSFQLGNEKVNAFYDVDGELIGTSKDLAFDKLPKAGLETITTKYTFPEYQVKHCMEFTNASNEKNFYVSFDKAGETIVLEITKIGMVSVFSKTVK